MKFYQYTYFLRYFNRQVKGAIYFLLCKNTCLVYVFTQA